MFCSECGKEVGESERFCSNCGTAMEGKPQVSTISNLGRGNFLAIIGGALLVISFFMPWISASSWLGSLSISGFNLMDFANNLGASDKERLFFLIPWLFPIGGGITAYFAYTNNTKTRLASIVSGGIPALVLLWLIASEPQIFKIAGIGLYLMIGAIACLGISAVKK